MRGSYYSLANSRKNAWYQELSLGVKAAKEEAGLTLGVGCGASPAPVQRVNDQGTCINAGRPQAAVTLWLYHEVLF
jgi:hypothetical protein